MLRIYKMHFLLCIMMKSSKAAVLACDPYLPLHCGSSRPRVDCAFSMCHAGSHIHSASSPWNHGRIIGPS